MPPSTLDQASAAAQEAAAEQVAAGRAATLRRRAREIAEAEEARRLWWRDPIVWIYGAAPVGAVAPGVALMFTGEPLGPTLAAIGVGTIVGFVALFVSTIFGEPFADSRLFPLFVIAIPAVTAAAGTLVVGAWVS